MAGADEARHIASALKPDAQLSVTVTLAQAGRRPQAFGWPLRIGGWGSDEAFEDWVRHENFNAVIDATHPFSSRMAERAARTAAALGIDHIRFLRPAWVPEARDNWTFLNAETEAADHIADDAIVFLGTGRRNLDRLANLRGRTIFCRVGEWPVGRFPFDKGDFLFGAAPFSVKEETRLFDRLDVDWLVARNTGSAGSWPKMEAARELGIKVALVRRPKQPEGPRVTSVAEALAWVRRRI